MKPSKEWLSTSGAGFVPETGRSGLAQLRHYTAEYRDWGSGPPLVLVPGMAGGLGLLGPLVRTLAKKYRVLAYQLRGETDRFALRRSCCLTDLVTDLAEFVEWQCLESPIIVGVSFGGALALEYAVRYPHRLQCLAVQSVGARFESGILHQLASSILARFPLPPDNPFINQFFNVLFGGGPVDGALFDFVTRQCWQTDQGVMAQRLRLVEQFDMIGRLGRIRVPTVVVGGDRDILVPQRSLRALVQEIPRGRLVRLPGCGHLGFVTHPQRLAVEVEKLTTAREPVPGALP